MMYDHEKSDPAIVAVKPTNKAGQPAAELVEPRAGAKGNVSQQSTGRAQYRGTVSQALTRIRSFVRISRRAVTHPRREKLCPNWARTDLCGGREVTRVPTAKVAGGASNRPDWSRCGAAALGRTYLLPPLSSGGASMVPPWLRFHIPLIEPDRQISCIRLSDKTHAFACSAICRF
jgi:hypothetical protein